MDMLHTYIIHVHLLFLGAEKSIRYKSYNFCPCLCTLTHVYVYVKTSCLFLFVFYGGLFASVT